LNFHIVSNFFPEPAQEENRLAAAHGVPAPCERRERIPSKHRGWWQVLAATEKEM
jgi:hypothetical protein